MKKKAIIFDIDGTLLYQTNRNPYDWSDLSGDRPIESSALLFEAIEHRNMVVDIHGLDIAIIVLTGRPESARETTEEWLHNYNFRYDKLIMKGGNQYAKTVETKRASIIKLLEEYDIICAFEDNPEQVEMLKEFDFTVYQVHDKREIINTKIKKVHKESSDLANGKTLPKYK